MRGAATLSPRGVEGDPSELLSNLSSERWEVREKALISLRHIAARSPGDASAVFTASMLKQLFRPIERQLKDLRSAILREACKLVSQLSRTLGDDFQVLGRLLIPTMVEIRHSANKVIASYMDDCCCTVLRHTVVRSAVPHICEVACSSKSKDARESCIQFIRIILNVWETSCLEYYAGELEDALRSCLEDASAAARITARQAFWSFESHWPQRASNVLRRVDARTQRLVESSTAEERLAALELDTVPVVGADGERCTEHRAASCIQKAVRRRSSSRAAAPLGLRAAVAARGTKVEGSGDKRSPRRRQRPSTTGSPLASPSSSSNCASPTSTDGWQPRDGERVVVASGRHGEMTGLVRFVGNAEFASGPWLGVELDSPLGRNDGSVKGVRYFRCTQRYGIFVRISQARPATAATPPLKSAGVPPPVDAQVSPSGENVGDDASAQTKPVGQLLLSVHRKHVDEVLESLRSEMGALSDFELLVEADEGAKSATPCREQIVAYLESIESSAESRLAAIVELKAQVAELRAQVAATNCL